VANRELIIGNKNYSSWSLRPWFLMKQRGIEFEEIQIPLYRPDSEQRIRLYSPSGKVPVMREGDRVVWESLAICEYLAEKFPHLNLWPEDPDARVLARSISHEIHAGFSALRSGCPMNVRRTSAPLLLSDAIKADVGRIQQIWAQCRGSYGPLGPFLFGSFSIADAMYAPVVFRFYNYSIPVDSASEEYMKTILGLPVIQEWIESARQEIWIVAEFEK
jgi:glutathione S-transferase